MLPCPLRNRFSNRLLTLIRLSFFLPPVLPNRKLSKPTATPVLSAKVRSAAREYSRFKSVYQRRGESVLVTPDSVLLPQFAVVDDPGYLAAQALAANDTAHEPVLQQQLARLEALAKFDPDAPPDRPLAGEPDHRPASGQGDVAL